MIYPTLEIYNELSVSAPIVPITCKLSADTLTPISLFQTFGCQADSFLLESVLGGERWARYSIMGRAPIITFECDRGEITCFIKGRKKESGGNPVQALQGIMVEFSGEKFSYVEPFYCGLLGYFGYDFIRYVEKIPDHNPDPVKMPDCRLMAPGEVIVFDHLKNEITLIANAFTEDGAGAYGRAVQRLGRIIEEITAGTPYKVSHHHKGKLNFRAETSKADYCAAVERAQAYIRDGDIFQVVLSQRFQAEYTGDALPIYRALRNVNPSPYLLYLQFDDMNIVGSSPEMLVRVRGHKIETCPIAGTRRRGETEAIDRQLEAEMVSDEKEISEHYMLVDLARNDVGKVSEFGSVEVKNPGHVEMYSHVMHIVTNVGGQLKPGFSTVDVLTSLLPAGTLSGAPKVRAMEIIEELESTRRGVYGGAIGYLGFDGNMDTCIAIRTAVIKNGKIYIQAGAGIVADSVPEKEFEETMNKAGALFAALDKSGGML
ncbi:anthranilate synthase component I [Desulfitobacterium sp.]|nr:anthranilate synthase component I [Desulfitobacterium sp.]MEA4902613.1 anthranilate synthase component I [Desulfitobacterium sp.]